jgi:hypothetical protein
MGIFGSTNKVWVVVFFSVDGVLLRGFEIEWGAIISMLKTLGAGL